MLRFKLFMEYFLYFDISCNTVDTTINKQPINNQSAINLSL